MSHSLEPLFTNLSVYAFQLWELERVDKQVTPDALVVVNKMELVNAVVCFFDKGAYARMEINSFHGPPVLHTYSHIYVPFQDLRFYLNTLAPSPITLPKNMKGKLALIDTTRSSSLLLVGTTSTCLRWHYNVKEQASRTSANGTCHHKPSRACCHCLSCSHSPQTISQC